jgi:ATP-binding cassette subfamily B protein
VDRSILLLDDIFSAVDSATENRIYHAMKKNFQGKTVLLITSRVSVLEQMDKVVYMQDGKVLEEGTPEQLLAKGGAFAALAELAKA